jgi:hypothetical protein
MSKKSAEAGFLKDFINRMNPEEDTEGRFQEVMFETTYDIMKNRFRTGK